MFQVAALGVLLTMLLALVRAIRGPSVYDRILAVNMFATKTMLLIAVAGFLTERPEWLDLALLYGLISFVAVLAVLRFSKYGDLGSDDQVRP
ncbi:MAG: monovalent cation/H+ antiporter complex subunit F [Myxococcota bacterium]